jgi:hypothetical protein
VATGHRKEPQVASVRLAGGKRFLAERVRQVAEDLGVTAPGVASEPGLGSATWDGRAIRFDAAWLQCVVGRNSLDSACTVAVVDGIRRKTRPSEDLPPVSR